jgi:S-formylglutathione hydrolase FrmB
VAASGTAQIMTRITRVLLTVGGLAALMLAACPTAPQASAAQRVITWNLRSKYVTKSQAIAGLEGTLVPIAGPTGLRSWVVLPNGYTATRCWPVLYLLHAAGAANEWLVQQQVYENLPAIVVIPGGGPGQYTNQWNDGARSPAWENWFFDEVMPKVSKTFPICAQRRFHAIAGSSMGGFGAMYLASQRPDYFGTAASFSGVIAISDPVIEFGFGSFSAVWGPPGGFYELGHDPSYLLPNLAHTRLFVDVGNGIPIDPVSPKEQQFGALGEAVMSHEASVFVAAAHRDHVRIKFDEHDGIHTQDNWNLDLQQLMAQDPFGAAVQASRSWRFTTVAQDSEAWGYQFDFSTPPGSLESFAYSRGTLRGVGTGRVTLISPAGKRLRAKLPFVLMHGTLSTGRPGANPNRPSTLPIPLTLRSRLVARRALLHVSFKTGHLGAGRAYELKTFQSGSKCTTLSIARVGETQPGHTVRFTIRPGAAPGHPRGEWCKGPGQVNLTVVQKHASSIEIGTLVGEIGFVVR